MNMFNLWSSVRATTAIGGPACCYGGLFTE